MTELIVPQFPADVTYPLITDPTRPAHSLERPTFEMPAGAVDAHIRSEEHTSELQSLMRISYAVFCLKKKNKTTLHHTTTSITRTPKRHTNKPTTPPQHSPHHP